MIQKNARLITMQFSVSSVKSFCRIRRIAAHFMVDSKGPKFSEFYIYDFLYFCKLVPDLHRTMSAAIRPMSQPSEMKFLIPFIKCENRVEYNLPPVVPTGAI